MTKWRVSFRHFFLSALLAAVLMPFASRQLLSMGLHCFHWFRHSSYSSKGQGSRWGRSLLRQLETQAQKPESQAPTRLAAVPMVPGDTLTQRDERIPQSRKDFPADCFIPLRI